MKLMIPVAPYEVDEKGNIIITTANAANDNWMLAARLADSKDPEDRKKLKKMFNTRMYYCREIPDDEVKEYKNPKIITKNMKFRAAIELNLHLKCNPRLPASMETDEAEFDRRIREVIPLLKRKHWLSHNCACVVKFYKKESR